LLVPKLFTTLRGYDRQQATADITAGVIVGVVALPLAIAFAIASGVTPDRGLYTAIIAGFLISALGGSRVQIGGPTGAFVVIVYGIVQQYGVDGLLVATVMAGVILIGLGLAGLGGAIKFIPYPVVTGFTSGIALLIFSGEIKDLLGLQMGDVPADFVERWRAYGAAIGTLDPTTALLAAISLAVLILWPRLTARSPGLGKVPAAFIVLVGATAGAQLLGLDVETVGSRYGQIPSGLPAPRLPHMDFATVQALVGPAFAIALLGGIEALLSAVVSDAMIGGKHRSNMELVAQGVANVVTPLFGGIPATGAIARTATNIRSGGRTPVAGIVHAVTLLLITLFFGRLAGLVPFAALAAILVIVAYNMSEWRHFKSELSGPRSDVIVLLATFVLTVVVDLVVALETGMVLAAFLFMKRMAEVTDVRAITAEFEGEGPGLETTDERRVPEGVEIYGVNGPFFFGAAQKFVSRVESIGGKPRVLILQMEGVTAIDSTGLNALRHIVRRNRDQGTLVILSNLHEQPRAALVRSAALEDIGEENIVATVDDALEVARDHALALRTIARSAEKP
jgi:sulfate permease, SulP family